ncbi:MAG: tetratricopeptide repeat protein [Polyangiaceae bacterium]|nr:tetratricopeptide repeat protein [Polyangiaceae bacterium]
MAAALLCAAAPARADNAGAAQQLYDRAVELMGQKNYAEACPKLEEVTRLVPDGFGAKLTLAECYEAQGRLASAWEQYMFVESAASRANQGDRQRLAAERAAALKP